MDDHNLAKGVMLVALSVTGMTTLRGAPINAAPPLVKSDDYRLVVLNDGPVGYWRLGETNDASPAADETGNHRDGKYVNHPKFVSPGALAGDANGAIVLDGKAYVEIPDDAAFSQPTSGKGLTVEVWMRPDRFDFPGVASDKEYIHWLGKGENGKQEWGFRLYNQDHPKFPKYVSAYIWNLGGGEGAGAHLLGPLNAGQWVHIVGCFEPGNSATRPAAGVRSYKNGQFQQGPPDATTLYKHPPRWQVDPADGDAPLRIGLRDGDQSLLGAIDEVAIYPRVLTAAEIERHYDIGAGKQKLTPKERIKLKAQFAPEK
jgi:hypothetical protein